MSPTIRTLLTSFLIAAVAPVGLAILDLEQPAFAKNGNGGGNGGGHGGGHGGGNGGGHGNSGGNGNSGGHGHAKTADADADTDADVDDDTDTPPEGLAPNQLGKLNGVLHANPNAIAHANANSPIGTAREFGEALAGFLDAEEPEEGGEEANTDEEATDPVTVEQLGEMMANMTNKPVTADQVQAVAEKLGIETTDEVSEDEAADDEAAGDETAGDETAEEPSEGEAPPALDQETAQKIADEANEIHGFTDDTPADDGDDETADAGDTADETVTN